MRVHQKTERNPAELAELKAERERFSRERPGPDDLDATGDYDGPYRQGDVMALLMALASLKQERERQGLSLAEVSERSGLDKGMISRLENGKILNPTVLTLGRYSRAVGGEIRFDVHFPAGDPEQESQSSKTMTPDQMQAKVDQAFETWLALMEKRWDSMTPAQQEAEEAELRVRNREKIQKYRDMFQTRSKTRALLVRTGLLPSESAPASLNETDK